MSNLDIIVDQLRDEARYQRVRTAVDLLVSVRSIITYQPFSVVVGFGPDHQNDPNLHRYIKRTMKEDHIAGRPFAASLVINKQNHMPGMNYFIMAASLGHIIEKDWSAEREFWNSQIRQLGIDPDKFEP
jgi:hypothetical protein